MAASVGEFWDCRIARRKPLSASSGGSDIEEIDESQVEPMRATGAMPAQVMSFGIVPQVFRAFATICVFRWDINVRESTVLGLVGAGGLGLALEASLSTLKWPQVSVILLIIPSTVVISEWVTAKVRKAII
jgi:phosphonate transport system permease protein